MSVQHAGTNVRVHIDTRVDTHVHIIVAVIADLYIASAIHM